MTVWLLVEAVYRIKHPNPIVGLIMVCIAAGSLVFNIIMNRILAYNPVVNAMDEGLGATKQNKEKEDENKKYKLDLIFLLRDEYLGKDIYI